MFPPEYTDQDLADALAQMQTEFQGLRNVFLQAAGGGQFVLAVPAVWRGLAVGDRVKSAYQ